MACYPVIMCGGLGVRLWPASRPARPKQFIPLIGERSLFQETALRVAGIAGARELVIVAGAAHADIIRAQLADIGVNATILLEPEARDSGAAIAAASAWIVARDAEGVALIVASDHHVPDAAAFRTAAATAVEASQAGYIVTMGVTPSGPNTAYGYIAPGDAVGGARKVAAFVEKPDAATAETYIAKGYLWNSGNFVARASVLLDELDRHAPEIAAAARRAVAEANENDGVVLLTGAFRSAPKISIDYAVMEKTEHAAVLPVSFAWTDLGAWDAVWSAREKDGRGNAERGEVTLQDAENVLVSAAPGVRVVAIGVSDVAIVAEAGQVLVCDLASSQSVKTVVDALKAKGEDVAPAPFEDLAGAARWFDRWLRLSALPFWCSVGLDHARGGFHEAVSLDGAPLDLPRRMRVQARQAYVYAQAGQMNWPGPWRQAAQHGLDYLEAAYKRPDGLYRTLVAADGATIDETAMLYDQAFVLLALAALKQAGASGPWGAHAETLRGAIERHRHADGGFRESPPHPFQANAHMHLFEAAQAWSEAAGGPAWGALADEIAQLALTCFVDAEGGFVREFFDASWARATGDEGRHLEPGHQFEWAWLFARAGHEAAARKLFAAGVRGIDPRRNAAVDAVWDDFSTKAPTARLWVQTEYLKAALILGQEQHALAAAKTFWRYLQTPAPGLWYDTLKPDNTFVDEPASASSFYHIITAIRALGAIYN